MCAGSGSVVVGDFDNDNGDDFRPIEPTVIPKHREEWLENQSAWMIEIHGELPGALALELVAPGGGQLPNISEGSGRAKFVQPPAEHFARTFSERLLAQPHLVARVFEFGCSKNDVQAAISIILTQRVKDLIQFEVEHLNP
jgi:hypothetical protein